MDVEIEPAFPGTLNAAPPRFRWPAVRIGDRDVDLRRVTPPEEPDVVLARLDPALLGEVAPAAPDGGELDRLVLVALFHHEPLRAADDVRVEPAAQPAVAGEQHHFDAAWVLAHFHQRVRRHLRRGACSGK